jgi:type IV pilus assembly protein PilW
MKAPPTQHGMTLIECMISLTLGMLVILACTALLLSARNTYLAIDDNARINDTGAFALAAIGAAIRQAGYADRAGAAPPPDPPGKVLYGWDDAALSGDSVAGRTRSVNGSDVLFTRFMATSATGAADDNMLNCAGLASKNAIPPISTDAAYNWSIFYIARNREASHEPELFCKYRTRKNKFSAHAIARGVESLQFLYGVDLNGDGLPDTFLNAGAVDALDGGRPTAPGHWEKVVAVRIALSVHGDHNLPASDQAAVLDLFGQTYSALHAADDPGVRLDAGRLKKTERQRARRLFRSTVMLRNRNGGQ